MTVPASGAGGRLEVVRVEERHAGPVAEFFRAVWDPKATTESVLAARAADARGNVAEPGVAPPTWIAIQEGRVLGYVTTIPIRLWNGSRDEPGYWIKGLMVLPEFRGGPIGFLVLKAATAGLPLAGGLAVATPALRLFAALKYADLGAIPNWVRPLAPHRMLARLDVAALGGAGLPGWAPRALSLLRASGVGALAGWAAGLALRGATAMLRMPAAGIATRSGSAPDREDLDQLWRGARAGIRSGVVRDAAYLHHRYGAPGTPYRWVTAWEGARLAGVAVVREPSAEGDPRLKGVRVATLADVLFEPARPAVGLALLGAAERTARSAGADALLASTPVPTLARLLRRQGYLPAGGNVHCLVRDASGSGSLSTALAEWWLTRGDGQADEVF